MTVKAEETKPTELQTRTLEQIQQLSMTKVIRDEQQPRQLFDEESLEGMIASIEAVGLLNPIRVRRVGEQFVIIEGERRLRAYCKMGRTTIPGIVEEGECTEREIVLKQYIANCQRKDLNAIEKALAISRLMSVTGWNAGEAAAQLGESAPMATRLLALLKLPDDLKESVANGTIKPSSAYELCRIADPVERTAYALKLATGELTRDGIVGANKAARQKTREKATQATSRGTAVLGDGRSVTVAGISLDLESFISTLEDVLKCARKARPDGVTLKTFLAAMKDRSSSE